MARCSTNQSQPHCGYWLRKVESVDRFDIAQDSDNKGQGASAKYSIAILRPEKETSRMQCALLLLDRSSLPDSSAVPQNARSLPLPNKHTRAHHAILELHFMN